MDIKKVKSGEFYDESYFKGSTKSNYKSYEYHEWYIEQARRFANLLKPKGVLDYGCARGFFTKSFNELNILCLGVDVSKWAIDNCVTGTKDKVFRGDYKYLANYKDNEFDLVISMETLEHIIPEDLEPTIRELVRVCSKWFWITVPTKPDMLYDDDDDSTHFHILTKQEWIDIIEKYGMKYLPNKYIGLGESELKSFIFRKEETKNETINGCDIHKK